MVNTFLFETTKEKYAVHLENKSMSDVWYSRLLFFEWMNI